MFRNRTFKVLSSLILLAVFCTGQVAAAPSDSTNKVVTDRVNSYDYTPAELLVSSASTNLNLGVTTSAKALTTQKKNTSASATNVWTNIGPVGSVVYDLAIDPATPSTFYAGTQDGKVFKSTNSGANWVDTGLTATRIYDLVIDPATPSTLYAGTMFGVFKSTNGGATWGAVNTGLTNTSVVSALAIDPATPSTLYAVAGSGVFKSTNGGATWGVIKTGLTNSSVRALVIDPATPSTLYVGTQGGGVIKSTNGGATWGAINTGLTNSIIDALAIDRAAPSTLYVGTQGGGIFKSVNGGATWVNTGLTNTSVVSALAIDPATPSTLYAGAGFDGVFRSTDGGATWVNIGAFSWVFALVIDPMIPNTLYAAGSGVYSTKMFAPIVFVHGWLGFPLQTNGCTTAQYETTTLKQATDYFQGVGDKLKADGGYSDKEITYARLVSNHCYTPLLEYNVTNLMDAITAAKAANPGQSKVILITHSMGGLVARAYIEGPDYRGDVAALFTFGSPHLGTPDDALTFLLNVQSFGTACDRQPAVCEFSVPGMTAFNMKYHKNNDVSNKNYVIYHAISGDAPLLTRSALGILMGALIPGEDDGAVPTDSGRATSLGTFDRWTTDEVHGPGVDPKFNFGPITYFIRNGGESWSYDQCIRKILVDGASNCGSVSTALVAQQDVPTTLAQHTPIEYGTLLSGQTTTRNLSLEGGPTLFASQWQDGTLAFTLVDPNGQTINPAFAAANPGIVTYTVDANAATYYFPIALTGTWQIVLQAMSVPANGSAFSTFAALDSNVALTGNVDKQWYTPGTTATVTATLGGSPSSATVIATILRADSITDTLTLSPIGNGQYQGPYIMPNAPGYAEVRLVASGTTGSSLPFERGTSLAFQISPNTFSLNNKYADTPSLYPDLSHYQFLNVTVGINAAVSGKVGLSADLVDGNGNFVAHGLTIQDVAAGTANLTLQFDGTDIFSSQHNGPYTVTNVLVTDESGTALVTQQAQAVYTTAPYFYTNFANSNSFADVPSSYWASSYIERLYSAGITGGCATSPSLMYCPDSTVTRAQMAVFLLKGIHGSSYTPPDVGTSSGFADVATNYWAAAWIKQLAAEGITGGCGAGIYCPDATVTRAQMAIFLLRAKHSSSYSPPAATGVFSDVPVGYWADKWIEQLAAEDITSGCGTGVYCPESDVTRAQMAVFLVKAFNLP